MIQQIHLCLKFLKLSGGQCRARWQYALTDLRTILISIVTTSEAVSASVLLHARIVLLRLCQMSKLGESVFLKAGVGQDRSLRASGLLLQDLFLNYTMPGLSVL